MDEKENIDKPKTTNKIKDLIKNTIIIFFGKASTQLISFLLLPLYTSYIITSEYGYVDLITTYVSLIVLIVTLELDLAAFRFLIDCRGDELKKQKIISNTFLCLVINTLIFTVIYYIINNFCKFQYAGLILLMIITNIFSSVIIQIARGLGKNLDYAISCIIGGLITILLNVILIVKIRLGGKGLLISIIISNIVICLYLIIKLKVYKKIKFKYKNKDTIKQMIKYSAPLIPNQISWWIIDASDRTIVSFFLGMSANGIYSIANKIPTIFNGIYNIFHLSWSEQASLHFQDEDRDAYFSTVVNNGIKIFGSICLLIITILPLIFSILINSNYADSYYQIPILLLGILANIIMSLFAVIYVAKKLSKELAKTSIITAIINFLINIFLINYIGLYAASISTFIAYLFVMIYRWFDIKKYISITLDKKIIFTLILSFFTSLIFYYLQIFKINILVFFMSILVVLYINKKNILNIINFFKKIIKKNKINQE